MKFLESVQHPQKGATEMQMFSINAASLLLERDRRTVTKAMFGVPPDAKEKKQPRWKMSTIVDALDRHGGSNNYTNGNSAAANANRPPEYSQFDAAFATLEKLPTLQARRKAAIKIMPVLHNMIAALGRQGRRGGEHPQHTQLRGDAVYRVTMAGFQSCARSSAAGSIHWLFVDAPCHLTPPAVIPAVDTRRSQREDRCRNLLGRPRNGRSSKQTGIPGSAGRISCRRLISSGSPVRSILMVRPAQ
jgi:hypothetical protein